MARPGQDKLTFRTSRFAGPSGYFRRKARTSIMAHLPAHIFFPAQSEQNRYQGDARTPSSRLQPGHAGYL